MAFDVKHGLSHTVEYKAWQTMRLRCIDPDHPAYPSYGGRGITVCERWLNSVQAFVDDMGLKSSPAHELDRRKNNLGYSPENCRWVTRKVNDRNRRSNRMLEFRGETHALAEWCERLGLPRDTVRKRLEAGLSVDDALSTPVRPKSPKGTSKPKPPSTRRTLSASEVLEIRRRAAQGESYPAIAAAFGIAKKSVGKIVRRERWARLAAESSVAA